MAQWQGRLNETKATGGNMHQGTAKEWAALPLRSSLRSNITDQNGKRSVKNESGKMSLSPNHFYHLL